MGLLRRARLSPSHLEAAATIQPRRASAELTPERLTTAEDRALPAVVIAGCQRCGTTSLYWDLVKHPLVRQALVKEVHFFDINWLRGERWYRAHFPTLMELREAGESCGRPAIAIEASPYYIFHPHGPRRMGSILHDTKVIVLLRNPVDRAFSNWRRQVQKNREALSFEAALDAEPSRLAGERERMMADERYESQNWRWFSYARRGQYVQQLEELAQHVPRDRSLVVIAEEYAALPQKVYRRVLQFLGLPDFEPPEHEHRNRSSGSSLHAATRARLIERFRPFNRRLSEWLGEDLTLQGWDA